ncbi:hypothetical protein MED121_10494 [Marinomonas sp. MED121]|nr:hypothetical protein MED121_10494 [Marinomonas sp. MED121]
MNSIIKQTIKRKKARNKYLTFYKQAYISMWIKKIRYFKRYTQMQIFLSILLIKTKS